VLPRATKNLTPALPPVPNAFNSAVFWGCNLCRRISFLSLGFCFVYWGFGRVLWIFDGGVRVLWIVDGGVRVLWIVDGGVYTRFWFWSRLFFSGFGVSSCFDLVPVMLESLSKQQCLSSSSDLQQKCCRLQSSLLPLQRILVGSEQSLGTLMESQSVDLRTRLDICQAFPAIVVK